MATIKPLKHACSIGKNPEGGFTANCVCGWSAKGKTRQHALDLYDDHEDDDTQ